jgi:ABC-type uncharacterized transport system permease subunit
VVAVKKRGQEVTFLLKLICNILILLLVYVTGTYLWEYLYLNFFLNWTKDNAWIAVTAIAIGYGVILSSMLFSVVEKLLPS